MIFVLLLLILACSGFDARADIYRYVNDEGVECFTDAPLDNNASLVMKERKKSIPPVAKTRVPHHLSATGIAEKIGTHDPGPSGTPGDGNTALPVQGRITSFTGLRHDPIDGKLRHHNGVDIATPLGTPVKPVAPGVVVFSGARPGYGNMVIIEHPDGVVTLYAHNDVNLVTEGEHVEKEATIALSGSTGRSTGPHLHFEAWRDGENITPTFTPDGGGSSSGTLTANRGGDGVRRILQADGTLLFTNLR